LNMAGERYPRQDKVNPIFVGKKANKEKRLRERRHRKKPGAGSSDPRGGKAERKERHIGVSRRGPPEKQTCSSQPEGGRENFVKEEGGCLVGL